VSLPFIFLDQIVLGQIELLRQPIAGSPVQLDLEQARPPGIYEGHQEQRIRVQRVLKVTKVQEGRLAFRNRPGH
jgi:hypothetical protein